MLWVPIWAHTALVIAFLIWDRRSLGRFHPATVRGTVAILLATRVAAPIAFTDWCTGVAVRLAGMGG